MKKKLAVTVISIVSIITTVAQSNLQQIEVLILGTVHDFKEEHKNIQHFEEVISSLQNFNPEIICIESIPIRDTLSLQEVRSKKVTIADGVLKEKQLDRSTLGTLIDRLLSDVSNNPKDYESRAKLAMALYANYDFWNAYYHFTILDKAFEKVDDSTQRKSNAKLLYSSYIDYKKIILNEGGGEYGNIVFPLADKLNLNYLRNVDYRKDEGEFLSLTKKILPRLLLNFKAFKLLKRFKTIKKTYTKAEANGTLIDYVNTPEFRSVLTEVLDELSEKWCTCKKARRIQELWLTRNKIMAERIIGQIRESGSKKILVTLGTAHVDFVKRYLEQDYGVKVTTYYEWNLQDHSN